MNTALIRNGSATIVWTTWAILVAAAALSILSVYSATHESDAVSVERQVKSTQHAIETSIDELALQQEAVAVWDDAARHLEAEPRDMTWIHDNIGSWLHRLFQHNEVFILDGTDKPIYAAQKGAPASTERFTSIQGDLNFLVDGVRGRVGGPNGKHDRNAGKPLPATSTVRTTARTTHDSHLMLVGGRPAVASAMLIQSSTEGYVKPKNKKPILISVRYLDEIFIRDLKSRQLLAGARISRTPDLMSGDYAAPLVTERGESIAYLIWKPELPGSRVMKKLLPATLAVLGIIIALILLLSRRLQRAIGDASKAASTARHLAMHDPLTGLPNRTVLQERLDKLTGAKSQAPFVLILLDVDEFKIANDTLGHDAGDAILRAIGDRLRDFATDDNIVARLGGDEFGVLINGFADENRAESQVRELLKALTPPVRHNEKLIECRMSAGATICNGTGTASSVLKEADLALYAAKAAGRDTFRFYNPSMSSRMLVRRKMITLGKQAIAGDYVTPFYQPKVDLRTGKVVGLEALLRCCPPGKSIYGPHRISAAFEDRSLAKELSKKIRAGVVADMMRWRADGLHFGHVAINAAGPELSDKHFTEELLFQLAEAGLNPADLQLEVTESVLLGRTAAHVQRTLESLHKQGIKIALDDFGTGFASLSHLKQFPVDVIKIDRSFIRRLQVDELDGAIVHALIELATALELEIVAEGIETSAQRDFLAALGCGTGQGYLFGRPARAEHVWGNLQSNRMLATVA